MKLWQTFEYPGWPEGEPITDDLILENLRLRRTVMLQQSDWTQLPDAPVDSAAWAAYRQALRDLPQSGTPRDLEWPEPPA